ncbi:MAG TPA: ShlB/FhaC/HecB family hemolysin secretion/activation protein, partial [Novosphingobium sp.]|nr:ShlB/FhaC/HecB family hemolysin secretion/activation protein [Novosphingobium sp.]
ATMLRRMGFLATVQVPPQRIENGGTVQLSVLAAKLVGVEVRGRPGNAERQIAAHLRHLTSRPWFNTHEAERQLLLLRDLPGFDVRLTLRPAHAGPGEVIGEVMVKRRPVDLVVGGQNLSSKATGREGVMAQLTLNDLTGMADRTTLSLYTTLQTSEQTVFQLAHDFALGANGLRLGGRFVYGRARPDIANKAFLSHTWIGAGELSYPLLRAQDANVVGAAGFEAIDQLIDFGGTRFSADRLRVAYARLDGQMIDGGSLAGRGGYSPAEPRLALSGEIEVRKGVAGFGASRACVPLAVCLPPNVPISNLGADPQGGLVRGEATLEFRPVRAVTVSLRPRAQYSSAQLLSYEQFTLGNYTVGRGYDPGTVQGDKGVALAAELRIGRLRPKSASDLVLQPYAFLDAGWAWNNDNGLTPMRRLVSAGGGVRARWGDRGDLNLLVAVPLERAPGQTQLGAARVLLTFSTRLIPWSAQ